MALKKYNHISIQVWKGWVEQTPELDEKEDQWFAEQHEI